MKNSAPRGRRPGQPETRDAIRDAARARFVAEGYAAVTLRSIAADAGVDVALVSYYFGSKKALFGEVMALPANPAFLFAHELDQGIEGLGERVLRSVLATWDEPTTGGPLAAMGAAAIADPETQRLVSELVSREIVALLAKRLGGRGAQRRAAAFSAIVGGLITTRWLIAVEPMASLSHDEVVKALAPSLQLALEGP